MVAVGHSRDFKCPLCCVQRNLLRIIIQLQRSP
jgi:hypothetical protein